MDFVVSGDKRGYYEDEIERLGAEFLESLVKRKIFLPTDASSHLQFVMMDAPTCFVLDRMHFQQ